MAARKPLSGRRIVVTRPKEQAEEFVKRLRALGATIILFPTIRIDPPDDLRALDEGIAKAVKADLVIFTSTNGVESVARRMVKLGTFRSMLGGVKVCAVGPATARAAGKAGFHVDLVPGKEFNVQGLTRELRSTFGSKGLKALDVVWFTPKVPPSTLDSLPGPNWRYVFAYKTVKLTDAPKGVVDLLLEKHADVISFTSPSTFAAFVRILGKDAARILRPAAIASIGPVTTKAAEDLGYTVAITPKESTVPALVDAIAGYFPEKR